MLKAVVTPTSHQIFLGDNDLIVSKTDHTGKITYGNSRFIKISGYTEEELIGKPHSILRHPDMPKSVFKLLWDTVRQKKEIFAYVKNLAKDGSFYWVFANVTCTTANDGSIRDYYSSRRRPSDKALQIIPGLYRELLDAERNGGIHAGEKLLQTKLSQMETNYHDFVLSLQQ